MNIYIIYFLVKLLYQCFEPYIVEKQVRLIVYKLKLLLTLRRLYLVFNIIKLITVSENLILSRYLNTFLDLINKKSGKLRKFWIAIRVLISS